MVRYGFLDTALPQVMAHRGGTDVACENTMAAFANAVSLGYRYIETDVHLSADGVLVISHDPDLMRVAGNPARIDELSWAELSDIELTGGAKPARLDEVLQAFPDTRFNIEPKVDASVEPLAELVRKTGVTDRVCIGSFSQSRLRRIRSLVGPDLCTSPAQGELAAVLASALAGRRRQLPYGCVQIPTAFRGVRLDSALIIKRLQAMGLQVHYWTINDREEMVRLFDNGADMIMTDRLTVAKEVLTDRGQWFPPR